MHYEVELALIMGNTVRDLKESNIEGALKAIDSEQYLQKSSPGLVLNITRLCNRRRYDSPQCTK
jgi:hypothetical protein